MSILYLEAKISKMENCILNCTFIKHLWVLEVMSMLVDVSKKIVLWLWSPGSFFYFRAAIFKSNFFFKSTSNERFRGLLEHWFLLKTLKISLLEKCQPHKIVGVLMPPCPHPFPAPLYLLRTESKKACCSKWGGGRDFKNCTRLLCM